MTDAMHFNLLDLRLFVHVAEESNLRKGAERTCISLAAAGTRIKQLEDNIGAKLVYRQVRRAVVVTTPSEVPARDVWPRCGPSPAPPREAS